MGKKHRFLAVVLICMLVATMVPSPLFAAVLPDDQGGVSSDSRNSMDAKAVERHTSFEPQKISYAEDGKAKTAITSSGKMTNEGQAAPSEILVKFKPGFSEKEISNIASRFNFKEKKRIAKIGYRLYMTDGKIKPRKLANALRNNANIAYAEPNRIVKITQTPNDPYYSSMGTWGQPYQDMWGLYKMQADIAWDMQVGSADAVVAVSDTGIDFNHIDIQGNIWTNDDEIAGNGIDDDNNGFIDDTRGWDFVSDDNNPTDDNGHGTHVSGTIAGTTNNGIGVAGISWHSKIMPVKFLNSSGSGTDADGAATIIYAADNGARVINCSWGGAGSSQVLDAAIEYATARGVIVVCAAGNSSSLASNFWPAGNDKVLTVGATDYSDAKASFSNYGDAVEVSAPGVDILSLRAAGTYTGSNNLVGTDYLRLNGTSMASPHAAGLAALLVAQNPAWSSSRVMSQIIGTTDVISVAGMGTGRINAHTALTGTPRTSMQILRHKTDDSIGNGNGAIEAGESFAVTVKVRNSGAPVSNVTGTITTNDPYVTISQANASFGDMDGWSSKENTATPFVINILPTAPRFHKLAFTLTVNANDGAYSTSKTMTEGVSLYAPGWPVSTGSTDGNHTVTADIDKDGQPEVITASDKLYVLNGDGTAVPGWPQAWIPAPYYHGFRATAPVVGDIDADGNLEVVLIADANLHVWRADGTYAAGFPKLFGHVSYVNLVDIDLDGDLEIIAADSAAGKVIAYHHDGSTADGWPVIGTPSADGSYYTAMCRAAGDIDGDGFPEIIAPMMSNKVYAWNHTGTICDGWPITISGSSSLSPALADTNNDGKDEVFIDSHSDKKIYGFNGDGTLISGWPKTGAVPSIGDINSDGALEIVTSGVDDRINAYRADGTIMPGWPTVIGNNMGGDIQLADIDGDGLADVVARDFDNYIYAWRYNGSAISGFPLPLAPPEDSGAWPQNASVAIADINSDGIAEMVTGPAGYQSKIFAFTLFGPYNAAASPWPMHQHDARSSGSLSEPGSGLGDKQPPTVPANLVVAMAPTGAINLNWGASMDNVAVIGYKIERSTDNVTFTKVASVESPITTYYDTNLFFNTRYYYRVSAFDEAGNTSPASTVADASTPNTTEQPVRYEESDPNVTKIGTWYLNQSSLASGGYYYLGGAAGVKLSFSFYGTSVSWIARKDPNSGIGRVYIDGVKQQDVDLYRLPMYIHQQNVYTAIGLPLGNHTITIEVTGEGTPPTYQRYVYVDAFDVRTRADYQAPTPPVLSATQVAPHQVDLSWIAATDNSGAVTYDVYRDGVLLGNTVNTTYPDSIVQDGTYSYRVVAIDPSGNTAASNDVTVTVDATAPTASASPKGGTYSSAQPVTLSMSETGSIYYTTDGTTPSEASSKYSGPIMISSTTTLKFIAIDIIGNRSIEYSEAYTIDTKPPIITASPKGGYINKPTVVTLTADEAAIIYYTINGSTPTVASTKYATPITIAKTTTLKFFGVDASNNISPVSTEVYTYDAIAPGAPTLSSVTGINPGLGLKLIWKAAADNKGGSGIASYDVYRSISSNGTYTKVNPAPIPASQLNFIDTTITAGVTYYYYLKATDKAGNTSSASAKKSGKDT